MNWLIIALAFATFVSTLAGGLLTLRFRKGLPYFFAFAAGSLVAVAFLDLLPESLEIGSSAGVSVRTIMLIVLGSFFLYSLLERFFLTHHMHDHDGHGHILGPIGASSLVLHSFLDGAAIGAAFQVNASLGIVVAIAVLCHDFTDGINTVTLMLKNKHNKKSAFFFLLLDALAPVAGVVVASYVFLSQGVLAGILAFFVGEFLYMGASHLLPETREHGKSLLWFMLLGLALIVFVTSFIG